MSWLLLAGAVALYVAVWFASAVRLMRSRVLVSRCTRFNDHDYRFCRKHHKPECWHVVGDPQSLGHAAGASVLALGWPLGLALVVAFLVLAAGPRVVLVASSRTSGKRAASESTTAAIARMERELGLGDDQ